MKEARILKILLLSTLILAPLLQPLAYSQQAGDSQLPLPVSSNETHILTIPLPGIPDSNAIVRIIIGGPPGYRVAVDSNLNGEIDNGEEPVQAPLQGDLAYTIAAPSNASSKPSLLQLIVEGAQVNALVTISGGGHYAAYTVPRPSQVLLAPPLPGKLLIAPATQSPVRVVVAGETYTVKPGSILVTCKPANATVVASNGSIVGVLYSFTESSWWATELVPLDMVSTPVLGFSSLHANALAGNATVYAFIVGSTGNYSVYRIDRAIEARPVKGMGVVFYAVYENGLPVAVAPDYPGENGLPRGGAVWLGKKGFLGDYYIVVSTHGSQSTAALIDLDGDGKYEVYSPGDSVGASYYSSRGASSILVLSDKYAPLIMEGARDPALYEVLYPKGGVTAASSLYSTYSAEAWTLKLYDLGEYINASLTVVPRSNYGGVTSAAIAAFTPGFDPIPGTGRRMEPLNDTLGSLASYTLIPVNESGGFYIAYMIAYQDGVGVATMFRSPPPLYNVTATAPPPARAECTGNMTSSLVGSAVVSPGRSIEVPAPGGLDLEGYADLFYHASLHPKPKTSTPYSTGIEEVVRNETPISTSGGGGGIPAPIAATLLIVLALAGYAFYKILAGERNP